MSPEFYVATPIAPPPAVLDAPVRLPFLIDTIDFADDDIREMLREVMG